MFVKLKLFEIYSSLSVDIIMKNKCYLSPPVHDWTFGTFLFIIDRLTRGRGCLIGANL